MESPRKVCPKLAATFFLIAVLPALLSGEPTTTPRELEVLFAIQDIPEHATLERSMLSSRIVPREYAAADPLTLTDLADNTSHLVTRIRIPKGSQIAKYALGRTVEYLSWNIPDGYVGAAIPVDARLLDLIEPGDRCDVLVSFEMNLPEKSKGKPNLHKYTATILQDIMILGKSSALNTGSGSIIVRVNPNEASYLELALANDVSIALRNPEDHEMHSLEMTDFSRLIGL